MILEIYISFTQISFHKCLFTLLVTQSVCCSETLNTMLLTNFENLNYISNIFQETHDFLVLMDPLIICIYLRNTDWHFRHQGNVRHPTSMLLKCVLVQTLNNFWNPFWDFCWREGTSCWYIKNHNFSLLMLNSW